MSQTVITYGTFDVFHIGHLRLLKRARSLGDRLIVGVSTDEFNREKGKISSIPYADRAEIVRSLRFVDVVIPESSWDQKKNDIKKFDISILCIGDDWIGKFDYLNHLCKIIYIERTPLISSSSIKKEISMSYKI